MDEEASLGFLDVYLLDPTSTRIGTVTVRREPIRRRSLMTNVNEAEGENFLVCHHCKKKANLDALDREFAYKLTGDVFIRSQCDSCSGEGRPVLYRLHLSW